MILAGGDWKAIITLLVYHAATGLNFACWAKMMKNGQFCIYCFCARFCRCDRSANQKNYTCGVCQLVRHAIDSKLFRNRRDDLRCILGIPLLDVVLDVYPHAILRITGT